MAGMHITGFPAASAVSGSTFVLPAISLGNAGQLAVDALLYNGSASTPPTPMAIMEHPLVRSCCGADALSPVPMGVPCTALEAFLLREGVANDGKGVVVLQQRGVCRGGGYVKFGEDLATCMSQGKIGEAIVLAGLDGSMRREEDLLGSNFRCVIGGGAAVGERSRKRIQELGWDCMEEAHARRYMKNTVHSQPLYLLDALEAKSVPWVMLFVFCAEGDNTNDGLELARRVSDLVDVDITNPMATPPSWSCAYG